MISSESEPTVAGSDDPVDEPFHDVPESTKAPYAVVSSPTRDVGLTSGSPCAR